jgi:hypothetical protein
MMNITPKKQETNLIVVPKPTQRLHFAPASKVYENKRRKALLKKFVY